jgi:hypothetical protein
MLLFLSPDSVKLYVCLKEEGQRGEITNRFQPSDLLQYSTNRYGRYVKRCLKQQAPCWYRLLTAVQNAGITPPICCAVTSRYCLVKSIKSITELEMLKKQEMENWIIYVPNQRSKQNFDGNMKNTGCLLLILAF